MTLHKITELYTKQFSVCLNITTNSRITATFQNSVQETNYPNKTYRYIHDLSMNKTSFV
jgi:hypothetical protein